MKGIDLSHYQEGLDLSNLKRGGYSFAILKLSEGRGIADASFDKFYDMAQAHGIPVGAYVFSHATNASVAQAEAVYAISLLKGRPLQLGVFMDIETTGQMQIPKEQLKQTVTAFKDTINRAGYDFGIYGSEYNAWSRLSTESANTTLTSARPPRSRQRHHSTIYTTFWTATEKQWRKNSIGTRLLSEI